MSDPYYAGIFVFDANDRMVLCVCDPSYPNDLKMAGGMSTLGETPEETARREGTEELRTQILISSLVFVEKVSSWKGEHYRYFFLAEKIAGALEKGATWEVKEKDASGRVVEVLTAKWVPIREFADHLFFKQYSAFGAILAKLASRDSKFCMDFSDLLRRFPEPENLGFEQAR